MYYYFLVTTSSSINFLSHQFMTTIAQLPPIFSPPHSLSAFLSPFINPHSQYTLSRNRFTYILISPVITSSSPSVFLSAPSPPPLSVLSFLHGFPLSSSSLCGPKPKPKPKPEPKTSKRIYIGGEREGERGCVCPASRERKPKGGPSLSV